MNWDEELRGADEVPAAPPEDAQPPDEPGDGLAEKLRKGGRQPLNDYGNGQRVLIYHGEDLMYLPRIGWFLWDGKVWAQDSDAIAVRRRAHLIAGRIRDEAFELRGDKAESAALVAGEAARPALDDLRARGSDLSEDDRMELARLEALVRAANRICKRLGEKRARHLRHAKSSGNSGPIKNMLVEAAPYVARSVTETNTDPLLVNTENCTLAFVGDPGGEPAWEGLSRCYRVEMRGAVRDDLITKIMPVAYDPAAMAPEFHGFLTEIQPDAEIRGFLQRWFGYSMTGLTSEQKLVFLHGAGRNGKSTLVDVVARCMGDYATSVPIESLTGSEQRKGADATPDLVRLPGARMVRASEPEEGIRFREATVKSFTGGEPILIRRLREEFVEVEPCFKLTISGNHKPNVRGTDDGIWRRLLLVPFERQIPTEKVDPLLPRKLWEERSGILNWLIAGALDFLAGGLRAPPGVDEATKAFREDSDPMRTFLVDACRITGDAEDFELARDLIQAFQVYQRDQGAAPWGNRAVSLRLSEKAGVFRPPGADAIFAKARRPTSSGYSGIRLKPDMTARLAEVRSVEGKGRRDVGEDFL